ncbi:MAG: PAS domain S-box-containing protein [Patescibacteria group bacterium]
MKPKLKILHLEDTSTDAELVERELKTGKIQFEVFVVSNKTEFEKALKEFDPDIVISDHTLPSFNSFEAIKIMKQRGMKIPIILVTATVSDEFAVEIMKAGADDYILKDRLQRLPKAIMNAMEKSMAELERQVAHEKMVYANRMYSFISHVNQTIVHVTDEQQLFNEVCRIAIEFGEFKAAWIGKFDAANQKINLVGTRGILQEDLPLFKDAPCEDNGPQNYVLQANNYYVCNNIEKDLELEDWKLFASKNGFNALIVLPIRKSGNTIGTFNLYAAEIDLFNEEEIALLVEVTSDISFALDVFEKENQRKIFEEKLRSVSERLQIAIFATNIGTWDWDVVNNNLIWDKTMYSIFGVGEDDFGSAYETWLANVHTDDIVKGDEAVQSALRGDTKFDTEFRIVRPDKSIRYIKGDAIVVRDVSGKPLRMIGTNLDITERKKTEKKITDYKYALNESSIVAITDQKGIIKYVNENFCTISNYSAHELIGQDHRNLNSTFHPKMHIKKLWTTIADGNIWQGEIKNRAKDGTTYWVDTNIVPFLNEKGKPYQYMAISTDITERKHAEQSLQYSQSNLTALIENTDAIIYSIDTNFLYTAFNKSLRDKLKLNYNLDLKIGDHVNKFLEKIDPKEARQLRSKLIKAMKGDRIKFEQESTFGRDYNCSSVSINPILEDETVIGLSCLVYDITQQKLEQLQKEKMSADLIQRNLNLEQFTFIVSHNLRGPTANIIGFSEYLQDENITLKEQKELQHGLSKSVIALDAVIKDLNNILQIKSEVNEKKEVIAFSKIVEDTITGIADTIDKHNVQVTVDFSEVDKIFSLKIYIASIFYNLISNSIKYCKPNEKPLIEIKSKKENDKIILTFKDNGLGIDLKKQGVKIFGLYNRFHSHVEGKGMGLYMVKTQVESLGGKISITSQVNTGTEFTIEFDNQNQNDTNNKTLHSR